MDVLPIKDLTDTDAPVFGSLNVNLGMLARSGLPVSRGVCVAAPALKLKTTLEQFNFKEKQVFEQTLTLVKKEIAKTPVPDSLLREVKGQIKFWVSGYEFKSPTEVWLHLLNNWLAGIKERIWKEGFYKGLTESLQPQIIIFPKKIESLGSAFFDPFSDDVLINVKKGKVHPADQKKIVELVKQANKKLLIPHEYGWVIDHGVKLINITPYSPVAPNQVQTKIPSVKESKKASYEPKRCTVKVIVDLSEGLTVECSGDGAFLATEKIFNLDRGNFDHLVLKLIETGTVFLEKPVFFKLADVREGMGGIRGALRLLHQENLLKPLTEALNFALNKKGLDNINIVLPFSRNTQELLRLKRELAARKLSRRYNLKHWLEICVPENIINLEDYLLTGLDGIVLNMDELLSHLSGFDLGKEELGFYKKEFIALIKFLEEPVKILHKAKMPVLAYGNLALEHEILEFLIEKGVWGIVAQKYESHSIKDLFYSMEKRVILRRVS